MSVILEVKDLVKAYGKKQAVKGISFNVNKGEVFGLIGPNGAGKTTTLRIIATLLKPTSGEVFIMGKNVVEAPEEVRELISYLPEEAGAYPNMTGLEYLRFIANIYYQDEKKAEEAIARGISISGLGESLYDRIKSYSKGMKRRLQLARALMVHPKLAILDEPTSGVDIIHAVHLRRMIKKIAEEEGTAIVLSSHNMLEVEFLCDRVALIHEGRIIVEGTPDEILREYKANNLEEAFAKAVGL